MNGYHIAPAPADVAQRIQTERKWLKATTDWRQQQRLIYLICRQIGFLALVREIEAVVGINQRRTP